MLSGRHSDTICKISKDDYSIIWRLNGRDRDRSDFEMGNLNISRQYHTKIREQNRTHTIVSFQNRPPETLRHLTEFFGIELDTFLDNLTPGRAVRLVPVIGLPIKLTSGRHGHICGILALDKLRDALPRTQASTDTQQTMEGHQEPKYLDPEELSPGQVMFYDGDKPLIWKGNEEGLAFFLSTPKSKPQSRSPSGTPPG